MSSWDNRCTLPWLKEANTSVLPKQPHRIACSNETTSYSHDSIAFPKAFFVSRSFFCVTQGEGVSLLHGSSFCFALTLVFLPGIEMEGTRRNRNNDVQVLDLVSSPFIRSFSVSGWQKREREQKYQKWQFCFILFTLFVLVYRLTWRLESVKIPIRPYSLAFATLVNLFTRIQYADADSALLFLDPMDRLERFEELGRGRWKSVMALERV